VPTTRFVWNFDESMEAVLERFNNELNINERDAEKARHSSVPLINMSLVPQNLRYMANELIAVPRIRVRNKAPPQKKTRKKKASSSRSKRERSP
jgi:hypothetical protein